MIYSNDDELTKALQKILAALFENNSKREIYLIFRFMQGAMMKDVARELGVSKQAVSRFIGIRMKRNPLLAALAPVRNFKNARSEK